MWFVSQLQGAETGPEPTEHRFMDVVRDAIQEQSQNQHLDGIKSTEVLQNPYLKATKTLSFDKRPVSQRMKQNFLSSSECMELLESPSVRKKHIPTTIYRQHALVDIPEIKMYETRECTTPKSLTAIIREHSTVCLSQTCESAAPITSKISYTHFNCIQQGIPEIRSKISLSVTKMDSRLRTTACNEFEAPHEIKEVASLSPVASVQNCLQCDSVPMITPNKIDSPESQKVEEPTPKPKSPELVKENDKKEAVVLYKKSKRDSPDGDCTARKLLRTKKKHHERTHILHENYSKSECTDEYKNRKRDAHNNAARPKTGYGFPQKKNVLPFHLRPLPPVHNNCVSSVTNNIASKYVAKEVPNTPKKCVDVAVGVQEPACVRGQNVNDMCKKVIVKSQSPQVKDNSTSIDLDTLSRSDARPTKCRCNSMRQISTRIPVPFQTYCVGYSKISTVQEKISYVTGNKDFMNTDDSTIVYVQDLRDENFGNRSFTNQSFLQKPNVKGVKTSLCLTSPKIAPQKPSSMRTHSQGTISAKEEPKLDVDVPVTLHEPTDLVKRIELIRKKLAQADSKGPDIEVESKRSSKISIPYFRPEPFFISPGLKKNTDPRYRKLTNGDVMSYPIVFRRMSLT
ncbi:hypothetical protein FQA39_LY05614 [Lamprigera yunnana]|nr:hypothetical protein FQA39_LY05614 [Lamprigera yunnana]